MCSLPGKPQSCDSEKAPLRSATRLLNPSGTGLQGWREGINNFLERIVGGEVFCRLKGERALSCKNKESIPGGELPLCLWK